MSFRSRLRLFFVLLVVVPMIVLALVLFVLTSRSETGKADAGISAGVRTAFGVYEESEQAAEPALREVAADPQLRAALASGEGIDARMMELAASDPDVVAIELRSGGGDLVARAGSPEGIAPNVAPLPVGAGTRGTLAVSVTDADAFTRRVRELTGFEVGLFRAGRLLSSTIHGIGDRSALGERGEPRGFELDGEEYRGRIDRIETPTAPVREIAVFSHTAGLSDTIAKNRLLIGGLIAGFLLLALLCAGVVSRTLTGQIRTFLQAARRLARGDFTTAVPVEGDDEFAQLGREFNGMSVQLEGKIEEVQRKRAELTEAIRRVGDALAMGLDRHGVVALAVRTAVDACEAESGRARPVDSEAFRASHWGVSDGQLGMAMQAAERRAVAEPAPAPVDLTESGAGVRLRRTVVSANTLEAYALSVPMRALLGTPATEYLGVLSIARRERPFSDEEEELLQYLAGQAVVSIENASLHETVERQAVTDELTGLANARAFHSILEREIERSRRFDSPLGLVMLDLDHFKQINDDYGHQRGDEALALVAEVLRDFSRDIDAPARYGGEEMAVILPQTDSEGALMLAERVRAALGELRVDGLGSLRLRASFGVAALPENADDKDGLIAAADAALYRAKRAGRNRVERAEPARGRRRASAEPR